MPITPANGIDICYDTFGSADDPALLLVMGLGAQMIRWDERLCRQLADRGFHVIRFDNRDTGLSSKIEGGPAPDMSAAMKGDASSASYTLWDMADDAVGLLDALGIARAHIVGASMGGMVVQAMAIRHPKRVLSLCSIMPTTGDRTVGQSSDAARAVLFGPRATDRDEVIEAAVHSAKVIGSPGYPADEAAICASAAASYDRCHYPVGIARQMLAIMAVGDRTEALWQVNTPTVVIHGADDPLVGVSGGEATAAAIPDARLVTLPGMGHDLPEPLWPQIVDAIVDNTSRAQS